MIFNFTHSGLWKRIIVFSRLYGPDGDQDYFTVEVATTDTSEPHLQDLQRDFERHATTLGLVSRDVECVGRAVTEHAYPVFRREDCGQLESERSKLRSFGIEAVGRQGNFDYLSSYEVGLRARGLADKLAVKLRAE